MRGDRNKFLEWLVSIGTAAAVVGVLFVLSSHRNYEAERMAIAHGPQPGTIISVPGVDWATNRLSLIIVMQVGCHWCEGSASFYRDLLRSDSRGSFHPIAVLPQPITEAKSFLDSLGLDISDVRQMDFSKLGAYGTPTLILVDSSGKVEASWTGKLPPQWENAVFRKIGIRRLSND